MALIETSEHTASPQQTLQESAYSSPAATCSCFATSMAVVTQAGPTIQGHLSSDTASAFSALVRSAHLEEVTMAVTPRWGMHAPSGLSERILPLAEWNVFALRPLWFLFSGLPAWRPGWT